jgi:hypothetical protein
MTHLHVDTDAAARKRQEIGLSPRRQTASKMVMRPPEGAGGALPTQQWMQWLAIGAVALVVLLSLGVAVTRAMGLGGGGTAAGIELPGATGRATLSFAGESSVREEFTDSNGPLVRDFQPERWSMGVIAEQGVYRIRMLPGLLAWSTLGTGETAAYRFSTSLQIPPETPWGYGGIVGRLSPGGNVFLVQVDGQGRLRIQVLDEGELTTMQDWIQIPELEPAGRYNHLLVEDTGEVVTVFANGVAVWASESIYLPAGDVGVFGASSTADVAEANFDWVQLEPLTEASSTR